MTNELASTFIKNLKGASTTCQGEKMIPKVSPVAEQSSMINYNWFEKGILELGVGVSCCSAPAEAQLGTVWGRQRGGLINLISSLQGTEDEQKYA